MTRNTKKSSDQMVMVNQRTLWTMLLLFLMVSFLVGCGTGKRGQILDRTLNVYEHSLRWAKYHDAEALREEHLGKPDYEHLKSIKVSGYEVVGQRGFDDEVERFEQSVKIRYYSVNDGIERIVIDEQVWIYDDEFDAWLLDSEMPAFK